MFSSSSLTEEGIERIISTTNSLVWWHLTIWLYAMFQAVQLPTSITNLDTGLANMDTDTFPLKLKKINEWMKLYMLLEVK